jgi:hypothetical protein
VYGNTNISIFKPSGNTAKWVKNMM